MWKIESPKRLKMRAQNPTKGAYIYIYIYAYNLIRWATFRLQKVKKQRERRKNKARKGKDEKEDKTLKREKPPHLVWGFFWAHFYYKTGEKSKF